MDSNGDGIGDLPGIISKLDYIQSLGVDAIWISPFFKSPMKDFGYDISDYRDVDGIFGTLDDCKELIAAAHERGIKVMIDQVLSHTSDQHQWFEESRQDKTNSKADWYVWSDPKPDGSPPNNWQAIFGGPAWEWEPRRRQYFLHNFLNSQPDLNFHNPDVQAQILDEVEFWLKLGVDGLRLDAINFCFHDAMLRDNPAKAEDERQGRGFSEDNPYAYQVHLYNNTRPENLAFLEKLRELLDRYPGVVSLGEISSEDSLATMAEYCEGDSRLHMAYSFELLVEEFSAEHIRNTVETLEEKMDGGWPCWAISNHDVARVLSRWGGENPPKPMATMLTAMLCSLRGAVCTYQGEELGLTEAEISFEQLQDPFGKAFWPMFKGRDGCRTPMPWSKEPQADFTSGNPWLPIPQEHRDNSVAVQEADIQSCLHAFRTFMQWRQQHSALLYGDIKFLEAPENCLVIVRSSNEEDIVACFNLSTSNKTIRFPNEVTPLKGNGLAEVDLEDNGETLQVTLPGYGGFFGFLQ